LLLFHKWHHQRSPLCIVHQLSEKSNHRHGRLLSAISFLNALHARQRARLKIHCNTSIGKRHFRHLPRNTSFHNET